MGVRSDTITVEAEKENKKFPGFRRFLEMDVEL